MGGRAKKDAWMPLDVGDFMRDTGHLTTLQSGAYLLLLMQGWCRGGALPVEDEMLRSLTKMDAKDWAKARPVVMAFFRLEDDGWHQKRLDQELQRAGLVSEQRREAGHASATARERKRQQTVNGCSTSVATKPPTNSQRNGNGTVNETADQYQYLPLSSSSSGTPRETPTRENGWNGWENGREVLAGFYLDEALPRIFGAAGIDPEPRHETVARAWMREGIEPDVIVRTIERVVARPNHTPGVMLSYFDRPVREARV